MHWPQAAGRRAARDPIYTILARFLPPASQLKPEFLRRSEAYEQSIFRDSGSRDSPSDQKALRTGPGAGSHSGTPGYTAACNEGSTGSAPASAPGREGRVSASAAIRQRPVVPREAQPAHLRPHRWCRRSDFGRRVRCECLDGWRVAVSACEQGEGAQVCRADGLGAQCCGRIGNGNPLRCVWVDLGCTL